MFKCRILNAIKGSIFYTIHINQLHVNYTLTPKYPSGNTIQTGINKYTVKICCTSMQVKSSVQGFFFIKRGSAVSVYIQCLTGADKQHLFAVIFIANIDILLRSNNRLKKKINQLINCTATVKKQSWCQHIYYQNIKYLLVFQGEPWLVTRVAFFKVLQPYLRTFTYLYLTEPSLQPLVANLYLNVADL